MELYSIGQFAGMAGVSMRTLRYYDRNGLLSPSHRSAAGYRQYTEEDLSRLQYVLALKFVGFSLDEIRVCLRSEPKKLGEKLLQQKAMVMEKRDQLDRIIRAIEQAEKLLQANESHADSIRHIIEVMHMDQKTGWIEKYMTSEQRLHMRDLMKNSYPPEVLRELLNRGWDEEDHRQHLERYKSLRAQLKKLVDANADPGSTEGQRLADRLAEMNERFSQGDPAILSGMRKTWENYNALAPDQRLPDYAMDERETNFIKQAMTIRYRQMRQEKR